MEEKNLIKSKDKNMNIVLIGMPTAGKSTAGVILAKLKGFDFIDSDLVIQNQEDRLLKELIEQEGIDGFISIENRINASLCVDHSIIATGGSVVYGAEAMVHLKSIGTIIYIKLSYETIKKRLGDAQQRGVVLREQQTLLELYHERCPLYESYADIIIDAEDLGVEELVNKIMEQLSSI
ncbi:shikimate kinase [Cohnella terricola]|uniref:Shikimate kinase n=1 Tax=Cohnella terricola TaxID=1289167 RepID=A0A559IV77_9BACL|nr:shikimate kinase [Cohnella terricola]TVX91521.1 shikimate kinase [Cohnella terricola]